MFQTINGIDVFVVDLTAGLPELPVHAGDTPELAAYAEALTQAIEAGMVTELGKYGINLTGSSEDCLWQIFRIDEPVS